MTFCQAVALVTSVCCSLLPLAPRPAAAQSSELITPVLLLPYPDPSVNDYRPVVNADGTKVVFERTQLVNGTSRTSLYIADLATGTAATPLVPSLAAEGVEPERPDWCWRRRKDGQLEEGPLAFSVSPKAGPLETEGVYTMDVTRPSSLRLLPNTADMVYPAWYPGCRRLAVDHQLNDGPVTTEINARTGAVIRLVLANSTVWAGFPSVNQVDPRLIAFAGQPVGNTPYDQDTNYIWIADRATSPVTVLPLDKRAPPDPPFERQFQGRAGWWSPDGEWIAFESNRNCTLETAYAILLQKGSGTEPARQVTDCSWNAQHAKWFPPEALGQRTLLVVSVVRNPGQSEARGIAALDITALLTP